jgi:hypothetical protein
MSYDSSERSHRRRRHEDEYSRRSTRDEERKDFRYDRPQHRCREEVASYRRRDDEECSRQGRHGDEYYRQERSVRAETTPASPASLATEPSLEKPRQTLPRVLYYIRAPDLFLAQTYNYEQVNPPAPGYVRLAARRPLEKKDDKLNPFYAWVPKSGTKTEPLPGETEVLQLPVPRDPEDIQRPCAHNEKTLTFLVQCRRNGTDPGKIQFLPHFQCKKCTGFFSNFSKAHMTPGGGIRKKYSDDEIKAVQHGVRAPRGKGRKSALAKTNCSAPGTGTRTTTTEMDKTRTTTTEMDMTSKTRTTCITPSCEAPLGGFASAAVSKGISEKNVHLLEPMQEFMCPTCCTAALLDKAQAAATLHIRHLLYQLNWKKGLEWSNQKHILAVGESPFLDLAPEILAELRTETSFQSWLCDISFRRLALPTRTATAKTQANATGGAWPNGVRVSATLNRSQDADFCLLELPSDNFVILGSLALSPEVICKMSHLETLEIERYERGKRSGSAGGFPTIVQGGDYRFDPQSLSPITRNQRHLLWVPGSNTCAVKTVYAKKDSGTIKVFNSVYNDPIMRRVDKAEKRETLLSCEISRAVTILEMKSRLKALTLVHRLGLHAKPSTKPSAKKQKTDTVAANFKAAVTKAVASWSEWKSCDASLGLFDMCLLEYAAGTGEMRNHQALSAHKDGNKSHFLETMTLFGRCRIPPNFSSYCKMAFEMKDGQLALLYDGVVLRFRCGVDVLHMNLDQTFHVPDPSRNSDNWSRVHGP